MTCEECSLEAVAYIDCDVEDAAGLTPDQQARQRVGLCITHAAAHGLTQPLNSGKLVAKRPGRPSKSFGRGAHALAGSHGWVVS